MSPTTITVILGRHRPPHSINYRCKVKLSDGTIKTMLWSEVDKLIHEQDTHPLYTVKKTSKLKCRNGVWGRLVYYCGWKRPEFRPETDIYDLESEEETQEQPAEEPEDDWSFLEDKAVLDKLQKRRRRSELLKARYSPEQLRAHCKRVLRRFHETRLMQWKKQREQLEQSTPGMTTKRRKALRMLHNTCTPLQRAVQRTKGHLSH